MKKKILVFTGSRADFGILLPLINKIKEDKSLNLILIAGPHHYQNATGKTYKEIKNNNLKIKEFQRYNFNKINEESILKYCGKSIIFFSEIINKHSPDLVILLGDRYEVFVFAISSFFLNIPIAHIHGGEVTEAAFDDGLRHSITKMSNVHFVCHDIYKKRVIQLGENPKNVFNFGSLAVEQIKNKKYLNKQSLFKKFGLPTNKKLILVTFHPETRSKISYKKQILILMNSLRGMKNISIVFTCNNLDTYGDFFISQIEKFCKKNNHSKIIRSMGINEYHNFAIHSDLVLGNSSSGIIEAPIMKSPTLNIGDRQKGRVFSKSIFQTNMNSSNIKKKIKYIFKNRKNIKYEKNFYKKNTSENMLKQIKIFLKNKSTNKSFYDL